MNSWEDMTTTLPQGDFGVPTVVIWVALFAIVVVMFALIRTNRR